jgi:methylated-DNA-[protein]-cysteine S-methyltransferase
MPVEIQQTVTVPIGTLRLYARNQCLTGIVILEGTVEAVTPAADAPEATVVVLARAKQEIEEYFAGRRQEFELPLDFSDLPPFTRRVLSVLRKTPFGATTTYGELAARVGNPRAARAVGMAMAANPLPIVIPCHRVTAANGRLGGYSGGGGVRTKDWLLAFEQRHRL